MKKKGDLGDFERCMVVGVPENDSDQSFLRWMCKNPDFQFQQSSCLARLNFLANTEALKCLLHYDATDQLIV